MRRRIVDYIGTGNKNVLNHKDPYCVIYHVGETKVYVNIHEDFCSIGEEEYDLDHELAVALYNHAGFNGGYKNMSKDFADCLVEMGWMKLA